jgi:hypothetical protein
MTMLHGVYVPVMACVLHAVVAAWVPGSILHGVSLLLSNLLCSLGHKGVAWSAPLAVFVHSPCRGMLVLLHGLAPLGRMSAASAWHQTAVPAHAGCQGVYTRKETDCIAPISKSPARVSSKQQSPRAGSSACVGAALDPIDQRCKVTSCMRGSLSG